MREYMWPLFIGIIFGVIDVLPIIKKKLDKFSITSAFVFHVFMPIIVFNIKIGLPWVIKGGIIYILFLEYE